MKKRVVSLTLALCLLLSLLPGTAWAAGSHSHPVCGTSCTHGSHGALTWTSFASTGGELSGGNYYLTGDVNLTTKLRIKAGQTVNLCLNGYKLLGAAAGEAIILEGGTLNICDCSSGQTGTLDGNNTAAVYGTGNAKLNIYSGKITGGSTDTIGMGGAQCTANIYGGTITGETAYAINNVGNLTIGGDAKVENAKQYAVYNNSASAVITVEDNAVISNSSGSGICSGSGTVKITGGTISGTKYGVENKKSVDVSGGSITGGQYGIFMYNDTATLSMTGNPTISGTTADLRLYTSSGTTVDNAKVDAKGYTGNTLKVEEESISEGAYAIKVDDGSKDKFTLSDTSGYQYAHKDSGLMIHKHSYTYAAKNNVLTESCTSCGHEATATISVTGGPFNYTGSAIKPATVTYSDGWVGGDLTVTYSGNTNVGTATAKITKNNVIAKTTFSIVKATQTAPVANEGYSINYTAATLTVNNGYEVNTNSSGTGTVVNSGDSVTPGSTLYIRKAETSTKDPSGWTAITIPARPAAPSGVKAENETITGASDGKLNGVSTLMEYSSDNGVTWTACAGTTVTGLAPSSYQVRTKATNSAFASEAATVTISAGAAKTYTLTVTAPAFDPVSEGYTQPQAKAVTIHSTGNSSATISAVTVSDTGKFSIGGSGNTVTAGDSISTWTIQPAANLSAGAYTATITVTYNDNATATAQVSFTVRNSKPTIQIDYQNETLTGFETGSKYTIDGTEVTPTNGNISIKDYFGKTVSIVKKGSVTGTDSEAQSLTIPAQPSAPTTPQVVSETVAGAKDGKITGVTATMEYSTDNGVTWTPCTGTEITGLGSGSYQIRTKATDTAFAGVPITLTISVDHTHSYGSAWKSDSTNHWHECSCGAKADVAAHSYDNDLDTDCNICGYNRSIPVQPDPVQGEGYSIDYTQEKVTVTTGYEINTKNDGTGEAVNTGATVTPGSTLYIRKSGDDSHTASGWVVVTIPTRPSAPAGVTAVSETTSGANDGKITGVSTSMEYSSDGGTTWTTCTGTEITPLAPGSYQVRTKATNSTFASTPITVTVETDHTHSYGSEWKSDSANHWHECSCGAKTNEAAHSYTDDQDATCDICGYTRTVGPLPPYDAPASGEGYSIDYTQEKITVISGYEINTKSDGTGTTIGDGGAVTPGTTLYIRKSGDDSHTASGWVVVTVPARPSAPTGISAVSETAPGANDGKITGVSTAMEYSSDGGTTWTTCTGTEVTPLAPGDYQVRTKATGGAFAGTPVTVTVPAKAAPTHYTVVFDSRGGSNVSSQTVAVGGKAAKPTDPTRRGYTFGGWYTEPGCVHRWNFENAPTGNLILYAKWVENTYSISGTITQGNQPVTNAKVTLKQGGTTIATTTSDSQGKYSFTGVAPGSYNVVAEQNSKTMTILVPITNAHATEQNLTMPSESVNSVLEVKGEDTPEVVVGGLEQEAEQKKESGKTVTVTMTVESKDETAAANANDIKATASGKTLDFMEIKVEKKVDEGTAEAITTTTKLLTIIIPFDFTGKTNITVYRYHGSSVNTLTTTANNDGEYITLGTESVTLYVKNFSTYAIGYEETATYAVTVQNDGHGTASASPASAAAGTKITLTASPNSSYRFKEWQVISGGVTISNNKFTMPAGNVAVKAIFEYTGGGSSGGSTGGSTGGGSSTTPSYPPVIEQPKHGTIKVSPSRPESGDKVTITVTPENGYETQAVTVTDRNGRSVKVTKNANGTYTFTQPSGKVTISATLQAVQYASNYDICPRNETCPIWSYTDASTTAWYHNGIHYCLDNGLMSGYGNGLFGPDKNLSRAMLAQILYNQAGRPAVFKGSPFDDVAPDAWYADAITWAAAEGIVSGYGSGLFGPNDNITREQLAVMLYRCEQIQGGGFKGDWMFLLDFTDREEVGDWAYEAMCWMTMNGVISGKGNKILDPKGLATRAQAAAMLQRYLDHSYTLRGYQRTS